MTKRKINIVQIILTIVFLLSSCSATPPEAPKTEYDYDHIATNIEGELIKEAVYTWNDFDKLRQNIIRYPHAVSLIVKKNYSHSYYWLAEGKDFYTDVSKETELVWTISTLEIVEVVYEGSANTARYKVGDEYRIIEFYGENPDGEIIDYSENTYFYEIDGKYHRIINNYQRPQIDEYYFLYTDTILEQENYKVVYGEWGEPVITEGTPIDLLPMIHPYGYVPDELVEGNTFSYYMYELSQEAYNESKDFLSKYQDDETKKKEINYHEFVVNAWGEYKDIINAYNSSTTIIFPLGFAAIFLCIIAVGIILAKRSKTTPSGTPPTGEQKSPDAQDTPDTPITEAKTASPPDVTEPPGPPKEE